MKHILLLFSLTFWLLLGVSGHLFAQTATSDYPWARRYLRLADTITFFRKGDQLGLSIWTAAYDGELRRNDVLVSCGSADICEIYSRKPKTLLLRFRFDPAGITVLSAPTFGDALKGRFEIPPWERK